MIHVLLIKWPVEVTKTRSAVGNRSTHALAHFYGLGAGDSRNSTKLYLCVRAPLVLHASATFLRLQRYVTWKCSS